MKISEHANHSEELFGIRGEDIHKWIDGFFDRESFDMFLHDGCSPDYNPYDHRKFLHCREALDEAYVEFDGKYSKEDIKSIFELHIKDDYDGYIPNREDFANGTFTEKYHENDLDKGNEPIFSKAELADYFQGKHYSYHSSKGPETHGFKLKIVLPTICATIFFIISIFTLIVPTLEKDLMDAKREMIKELTNTAESVIETYIAKELSGALTRKEAQTRAMDEIRQIRYGSVGNDYFWITDMHPKMIMHPYRHDLIGKDLTYYRDGENQSRQYLFVEFVKLVESSGEGYLQYHWQWKPGSEETVLKLSYVRGVPHWDWIIGTGIYVNDVEEGISRLINQFVMIFAVITICLGGILVNIILQSHRIECDRLKAETGLREAKNRYRALVEASNEGYILVTDGEHIYTNHTLLRMLGYTEKELFNTDIWQRIFKKSSINRPALEHIQKLLDGQGTSGEFEAQVTSKSGSCVDMIISISSIFFSEKNGHIISFRPITNKKQISSTTAGRQVYSNMSISKRVGDVCSKLCSTQCEITKKHPTILDTALTFEALAMLENERVSKLTVINHDNIIIGTIGYHEIALMHETMPMTILIEIEKSASVGHVVQSLNQLPVLLQNMVRHHADAPALRSVIGSMFEAAIRRFIDLSIEEMGPVPCDFAFLSLGSNARHEMTMFSDQDNAIVFADVAPDQLNKTRRYFLQLADRVCSKLNQAGYPLCPGGIMAVNPRYCQSETEWKNSFTTWIKEATPQSILDINVFFDISPVYGNNRLSEGIQRHITQMVKQNPDFLLHFAQNCLLYKVPVTQLGKIKADNIDGAKAINIKEAIKPIANFARLYAIKHSISPVRTTLRLEQLSETTEDLNERSCSLLIDIFDKLWTLRFRNQLVSHADLRKVNDVLIIADLDKDDSSALQEALSQINAFQSKLSYDFLGVDLS